MGTLLRLIPTVPNGTDLTGDPTAPYSGSNIPAQSVTKGTGCTAKGLSANGRLWFDINATSGQACLFRRTIPTASLTYSFRGELLAPAATPSVVRPVVDARPSSGQAYRVMLTPTRQLALYSQNGTTLLGTTAISGGLVAGTAYDVVVDCTVGTSTTGTITMRVCTYRTDTALAGGTVSSSSANLGTTAVTVFDVGSNSGNASAVQATWGVLQFENDRAAGSSIPPFTIPSGRATGSVAWAGAARSRIVYDIVVGLIQSNLRGRADDFDYPNTDFYRSGVDQWDPNANTIAAAVEPAPVFEQTPFMGPLNRYSRSYVDGGALAAGRRLLIVNLAWGGTGFSLPDGNSGNKTWWSGEPQSHTALDQTALSELDAVFAAISTGSRIVAFCANHGSIDGLNNLPKADFKARLSAWIDQLRTYCAGKGYIASATAAPYLMMQMRPDLIASDPKFAAIDAAQQEVAAAKNAVKWVASPSGSTYYRSDTVHFNAAGVRQIGANLYAAQASTRGAASGTVQWSGAATGHAPALASRRGAASGAVTWVGTAPGHATRRGAGGAVITWSGSAAGHRPALAVRHSKATGALAWTATAAGHSPAVGLRRGFAIGAVTWSTLASGGTTRRGSSNSGATAWAGSAAGRAAHRSSGSATVTWAATSTGHAPALERRHGTAAGAFTWMTGASGRAAAPRDVTIATWLSPDPYRVTVSAGRWTARLDAAMSRTIRVSAGDIAYATATILETSGRDITGATLQAGLGGYFTPPADWRTPDLIERVTPSAVKVSLLVGQTYTPPAGRYSLWVRVTDTPEREAVRAQNGIVTIT